VSVPTNQWNAMRTPSLPSRSSLGRLLGLACLSLVAACGGDIKPEVSSAPTAAPALVSADRIVTLQTRTMLAGLACGSSWGDPQAFARYARFTVRNAAVLRRSQQAMADRMGGMATFDRLHTEMSNGESIRLQAMGAPAYCAWMREPFYTTVAIEPEELDRWAVIQEASAQLR
jgi:hypothetical protein